MQNFTIARAAARTAGNPWRAFSGFFALLLILYACWLALFLPGILGEDSLAVILEIQDPTGFHSGKASFWYWFVRVFYLPARLTQVPVAVVFTLSALVFARILGWCWNQRHYKTCLFSLLFVCLAPHTLYFLGLLYPDGIYAVAGSGLMFEVWLGARRRSLSAAALALIALILPFAAFARSNGIIFLLPVALLACIVDRAARRWLLLILLVWCTLVVLMGRTRRADAHGVVYPLVVYETVNFLQARPMNLWTAQPRVLPATVALLERHQPIGKYLEHYDPDYWDPLQHREDGPQVLRFSEQEKKSLVRDFLRYNLWHNLPLFLAHRVNVFLVSALAQGSAPSYSYTEHILKRMQSNSSYRPLRLQAAQDLWLRVHEASYAYRWLLWSPFPGIALLVWMALRGLQRRDLALLLPAGALIVQLGGIFFFSIAGEYRYILLFFMLPVALLPVVASSEAQQESTRSSAPLAGPPLR